MMISGVDRRGFASVLLAGPGIRHSARAVQLQQVQQQLLLGRDIDQLHKLLDQFLGRFRHIHHARVYGTRAKQEYIRSGHRR